MSYRVPHYNCHKSKGRSRKLFCIHIAVNTGRNVYHTCTFLNMPRFLMCYKTVFIALPRRKLILRQRDRHSSFHGCIYTSHLVKWEPYREENESDSVRWQVSRRINR